MATNEEKTLTESLLSASPFLVKVVELVLSVLCWILVFVPFDNKLQPNPHHAGMVYFAYGTAVLINAILITGHLQGQRVPRRTLYTISVACGLLFLIAGIIVIRDWWTLMHSLYFHPPKLFMDMMIASGFFAVFTSVVFFIDIYLTRRYG